MDSSWQVFAKQLTAPYTVQGGLYRRRGCGLYLAFGEWCQWTQDTPVQRGYNAALQPSKCEGFPLMPFHTFSPVSLAPGSYTTNHLIHISQVSTLLSRKVWGKEFLSRALKMIATLSCHLNKYEMLNWISALNVKMKAWNAKLWN